MNTNGIDSLISAQVSFFAGRAPDPEVVATAKRRRFSASEKRRLLAEADLCKKPGELGAFMRRERLLRRATIFDGAVFKIDGGRNQR